jgi:hypothetical protein
MREKTWKLRPAFARQPESHPSDSTIGVNVSAYLVLFAGAGWNSIEVWEPWCWGTDRVNDIHVVSGTGALQSH